MKKGIFLVFLFLLLLSAAGGVLFLNRKKPDVFGSDGLKSAPDFWLKTLDNQRYYLKDRKGRTVVMIFWSTDCSVCKKEMIDIQDYVNAENLSVIAVCIDPENNFDQVKDIAEKLELQYPVLLDYQKKVAKKYNVDVLPVTVIIGSAGKIQYTFKGYDENVKNSIDNAIKKLGRK